MIKFGIIGECMVELFDTGDGLFKRTFGGDTLNTAVYMARCGGPDLQVYYATVLSDDPLSEAMLSSWKAENICVDAVDCLPNSVPGLYMIQTDEHGERSFLYWRNQAPAKKLFQTSKASEQLDVLMSLDWIYFSGISLAILEPLGREKLFEFLEAFQAKGGKVAYDGNYRPRLWTVEEARTWMERAYRTCDIALPSVDDECDLWGDDNTESVMQRLESFGCPEIVLKQGEKSCLLSVAGERTEYATKPVQNVVDTTAAGDSFCAGYLGVRQADGSIADAVAAGQRISSQVIQKKGAIVPVEC